MNAEKESAFQKELSTIINKFSIENGSNTPDFLLATYLKNCLNAYSIAVESRDKWFNADKIEFIINEPGS